MGYAPQSMAEPTREELNHWPGRVLVEFGASWCPHCQAAQPLLKQLLTAHGEVRHLKIEDGKGLPLGRSFRVKLWPSFVFLRDGVALDQLARPSEDEFRRAFERLLGE